MPGTNRPKHPVVNNLHALADQYLIDHQSTGYKRGVPRRDRPAEHRCIFQPACTEQSSKFWYPWRNVDIANEHHRMIAAPLAQTHDGVQLALVPTVPALHPSREDRHLVPEPDCRAAGEGSLSV